MGTHGDGLLVVGTNPLAVELLKLDLVAPGQDVLGAWRGDYRLD